MQKSKLKKPLRIGASILIASFLAAWALHSFINPNGFVGGGFGGISTILESAGLMKSYLSYLLLNVPALICARIFLKKDFTIITILCTVMISVFMSIMDAVDFFRFTGDRLLAAVYSGIIYGLATGVVFEVGGSAGGTEIVAKIIVKLRPNLRPSTLLFIFDVVVIVAGLLVFDIWSVVYAVVCAFAFERTLYLYTARGSRASMFYVITESPDGLIADINSNFKAHGYALQGSGGFSGKGKAVVKVLLPAGSVTKFKSVIKEARPNDFAFTTAAVRVCDIGESDRES